MMRGCFGLTSVWYSRSNMRATRASFPVPFERDARAVRLVEGAVDGAHAPLRDEPVDPVPSGDPGPHGEQRNGRGAHPTKSQGTANHLPPRTAIRPGAGITSVSVAGT